MSETTAEDKLKEAGAAAQAVAVKNGGGVDVQKWARRLAGNPDAESRASNAAALLRAAKAGVAGAEATAKELGLIK